MAVHAAAGIAAGIKDAERMLRAAEGLVRAAAALLSSMPADLPAGGALAAAAEGSEPAQPTTKKKVRKRKKKDKAAPAQGDGQASLGAPPGPRQPLVPPSSAPSSAVVAADGLGGAHPAEVDMASSSRASASAAVDGGPSSAAAAPAQGCPDPDAYMESGELSDLAIVPGGSGLEDVRRRCDEAGPEAQWLLAGLLALTGTKN